MAGAGHVFSNVLHVVFLCFIMTYEDVAWGTEVFPGFPQGQRTHLSPTVTFISEMY